VAAYDCHTNVSIEIIIPVSLLRSCTCHDVRPDSFHKYAVAC
jgi:hypothetical protein